MSIDKQHQFVEHLTKTISYGKTWGLLLQSSPELKNILCNNIEYVIALIEKDNRNSELKIVNGWYSYDKKHRAIELEDQVYREKEVIEDNLVSHINVTELWSKLKENTIISIKQKEEPLFLKMIINNENNLNQIFLNKILSSKNKKQAEVFSFFEELSININSELYNLNEKKPLKGIHFSVISDNIPLTKFLLSNGIDIETKTEGLSTPLFFATSEKMLDLLDQYNPNLEATNIKGNIVYDVVMNQTHKKRGDNLEEHSIWQKSPVFIKNNLLLSFKKDNVSIFNKKVKELKKNNNFDWNMKIEELPLICHIYNCEEEQTHKKISYLIKTETDFLDNVPFVGTSLISYALSNVNKPNSSNKTEWKTYFNCLEKLTKKAYELKIFEDQVSTDYFVFEIYKNILAKKYEDKPEKLINKNGEVIQDLIGGSFGNNKYFFKEEEYSINFENKRKHSKNGNSKTLEKILKKGYIFANEETEMFLNNLFFIKNYLKTNYNINVKYSSFHKKSWFLNKGRRGTIYKLNKSDIDLLEKEMIELTNNQNIEDRSWLTLNIFCTLIEQKQIFKRFLSEKTLDKTLFNEKTDLKVNESMNFYSFLIDNMGKLLDNEEPEFLKAFEISTTLSKFELENKEIVELAESLKTQVEKNNFLRKTSKKEKNRNLSL